ncbi:LysM peptidoglycan-binding domain-containing protein [Clavibacter lycopersici]|nr:LysM peptidoglycan-binding domain-containing protein [Clavibacter lycopersici]
MVHHTPASGDTLTGVAARSGLCVPDLVAADGGNPEILAGVGIVLARTAATPLADRARLG